MALVGSLVPGVEMATSRGRRDVAEGGCTFWGLEIGAKKELAQEPEPNANNKKQWAQGPIWILLYWRWRAE